MRGATARRNGGVRSVRGCCALLFWLVILISSHDVQSHVPGTQPLGSPKFHNHWSEQDVPAWRSVIDVYYDGRLNEAADRLESMLASDYDERIVRRNLAVVYKDLGAYRQAARQYERLAETSAGDTHTLLDWAFASLAAGDGEAAEGIFRDVLTLDKEEAWAHLGLGLARLRLGDPEGAAHSLTQAVSIDERLAVGFELLGLIYEEDARYNAAATAYRRALSLDSSYLHVYHRLAKVYESLGRVEDAWRYFEQSDRIFSSHAEVQVDVARFVEQHHDRLVALEREEDSRQERSVHVQVEPVKEAPDGARIRVGLLEKASSFTISSGGPFRVATLEASGEADTPGASPAVMNDGNPGARSGSDDRLFDAGVWRVGFDGNDLWIESEAGERAALYLGGARLELVDPSTTWIVYDLEVGRGYFWARREDRQVRGDLVILPRNETITLVNELGLESYLLGVVPAEMYPGMHLEALKAQAIAARTYTLSSLGRYSERGFDVLGGVASAAYRGVGREHPRTTEAVLATRGQVLTHGGRLIEALYHASAGGYTASSEDVWGGERAYLQAVPEWDDSRTLDFPLGPWALESWLKQVPDVYSSQSDFGSRSAFRWVQRVPAEALQDRVDRVADIGRIVKIVPGKRGFAGHLSSVTLVGADGAYEVRGDRMRSFLGGLKSNAFKVELLPGRDGIVESFLFFGAGFGHGVGLSQMGAAGMAEAGFSAADILAHYFSGVSIRSDF